MNILMGKLGCKEPCILSEAKPLTAACFLSNPTQSLGCPRHTGAREMVDAAPNAVCQRAEIGFELEIYGEDGVSQKYVNERGDFCK